MRGNIGFFALIAGLSACGGEGLWTVEVWGEDFIEEGIEATVFEDGCSVVFDTFEVTLGDAVLVDADDVAVGTVEGPTTLDLVDPGPQDLGEVSVPTGRYDVARFRIAPGDGEAALHVSGTLTCDGDDVSFDWSFDTETEYVCGIDGLRVGGDEEARTQLTVHGDHLFYDGLEAEDAEVRGTAIHDADANQDGEVTLTELEDVSLADIGYTVGSHAEVTTLAGHLAALTSTVGHVNGESHCEVEVD